MHRDLSLPSWKMCIFLKTLDFPLPKGRNCVTFPATWCKAQTLFSRGGKNHHYCTINVKKKTWVKSTFCAKLNNFEWLHPIMAQTGKAWVDLVNEACGNCFRTSSLRWKATQINNNKSCSAPIRGLFQKKFKKKKLKKGKNLARNSYSHASY